MKNSIGGEPVFSAEVATQFTHHTAHLSHNCFAIRARFTVAVAAVVAFGPTSDAPPRGARGRPRTARSCSDPSAARAAADAGSTSSDRWPW